MPSLKSLSLIFVKLSLLIIISGCSNQNSEAYIKEIEHWRTLRIEYLKSEEGFLNLAGLYWLDQPMNTVGSGKNNNIVFPSKAPDRLGRIFLENDSLWYVQDENIQVLIDEKIPKDTSLVFVEDTVFKTMQYEDLHWYIIKRGTQYGVRLKDYQHPAIDSLQYIENYPIDESWKLEAVWEAYEPPKTVILHNQSGMDIEYEIEGILKFNLKGKVYSLEPVETGEEDLFIMFYDETSGEETYGSGRYLYVKRPVNGKTVIDFNMAFNPPCVYTEYATCLFPHKANRLPIRITVGEKYTSLH